MYKKTEIFRFHNSKNGKYWKISKLKVFFLKAKIKIQFMLS